MPATMSRQERIAERKDAQLQRSQGAAVEAPRVLPTPPTPGRASAPVAPPAAPTPARMGVANSTTDPNLFRAAARAPAPPQASTSFSVSGTPEHAPLPTVHTMGTANVRVQNPERFAEAFYGPLHKPLQYLGLDDPTNLAVGIGLARAPTKGVGQFFRRFGRAEADAAAGAAARSGPIDDATRAAKAAGDDVVPDASVGSAARRNLDSGSVRPKSSGPAGHMTGDEIRREFRLLDDTPRGRSFKDTAVDVVKKNPGKVAAGAALGAYLLGRGLKDNDGDGARNLFDKDDNTPVIPTSSPGEEQPPGPAGGPQPPPEPEGGGAVAPDGSSTNPAGFDLPGGGFEAGLTAPFVGIGSAFDRVGAGIGDALAAIGIEGGKGAGKAIAIGGTAILLALAAATLMEGKGVKA